MIFATSDSSLILALDAASGKPLWRQQTRAYVFSSPAVAGDTVGVGVLNGSLEARDLATGDLRWDYRSVASLANEGWVLGADRHFNAGWVFASPWREKATTAIERQFAIGAFFSSPLVVDGVVYVGSSDGRMLALE